ncbi:MAG: hypothetical protein JJU29_21500 [Verrucomicrobia bacterium]|nr:hypothetical protein [Verrucomicrobiota bacterium]MCH8512204.1 hypothetical protein [Kiritimatiellia bacterium]
MTKFITSQLLHRFCLALLLPLCVGAEVRVTPVHPLHEITGDWMESREGAAESVNLLAPVNGTASAPFVVEASAEILREMSLQISPATGPDGTLSPNHFQIRYGATGPSGQERTPRDFDVLLEENPGGDTSFLPVWVTVRVPHDQPPGTYRGEIEVGGGAEPTRVPYVVVVAPFVMPNPGEIITHVSLYQSPEAVAWHYDVPLWSDEHLEKMEASFRMLGRVGQRHLNLFVYPDGYFGNTASIPFRRVNGQPRPDYSHAFRYLQRFGEHAGPLDTLSIVVWSTALHLQADGGKELPDELEVAFVDEDGNFSPGTVPMYGPPETKALWTEVIEGAQAMLDELGWDDTLLTIGVGSDRRPDADTVRFFRDIAPDVGWYLLTHGRGDPRERGDRMQIGDMTVTYYVSPFGPFRTRHEERPALIGGWDNEFRRISSIRFGLLSPDRPLINFRTAADAVTEEPWRGFTGLGLDFWVVRMPDGRSTSPLGSNARGWPRMHTNNNKAMAAPGPDGAIGTTRFEMLLEGIQESEARITLERVLGNPDHRRRLPDERAEEMEAYLKDRVNHRYALMQEEVMGSDTIWADAERAYARAMQLFTYAAESQRILIAAGEFQRPGPALRTWTNVQGHRIQAALVGRGPGTVRLRLADGSEHDIPIEQLSEADRAHLNPPTAP